VKLTDAFIGSHVAGAQRGSADAQTIILRGPGGFHLSRATTDADGRSQSQLWLFASLYDLLLFARAQGFAEVDPTAEDWQPVAAAL
jgi:hypothetical protein